MFLSISQHWSEGSSCRQFSCSIALASRSQQWPCLYRALLWRGNTSSCFIVTHKTSALALLLPHRRGTGTQCCLTIFWSRSACLNMWGVASYLPDAVIVITPGAPRGYGLPRDRSSPPDSDSRLAASPFSHNARSRDRASGRCSLPTRRGCRQEADEAQQDTCKGQAPGQCALARGEHWPCRLQMWQFSQWWEPKWVKSALCPSKQKGRQEWKENGPVSETIWILLWEPRSLIKAPTGLGIWLSFPDFILGWIPEKGCRAEMLRAWMENF